MMQILDIIFNGYRKELDFRTKVLNEIHSKIHKLECFRRKELQISNSHIISNMLDLVFPLIQRLRNSNLNEQQKTIIGTIETNLKYVTLPHTKLIQCRSKLTSQEFEIVIWILEGRRSKEISSLLNITVSAVDFHRNKIRKKLGLNGKKVDIRSHLLSNE